MGQSLYVHLFESLSVQHACVVVFAQNMTVAVGGYGSNNPLAGHTALVAYYGLEFHTYEGGPATTGIDVPSALWPKANATVDPRMAELVQVLCVPSFSLVLCDNYVSPCSASSMLGMSGALRC
jgi:hypothetical protein